MCSSAARKPFKVSLICRSSSVVTLLGSQQTNGKRALEGSVASRGYEVACARVGGMGVWLQGLMLRHCAWEQEWIKDKCVSERVSMCERCVCPNLFICCTGGL